MMVGVEIGDKWSYSDCSLLWFIKSLVFSHKQIDGVFSGKQVNVRILRVVP